jgi:hypothetical protein
MEEYKIRRAKESDIPFLAEGVIAGEKGVSDKCNYSTLFNLSEEKAKEYIMAMFAEEVDGCEFSLSSFFVTEFDGEPVAAFGGWIECFEGNMPSKILKSNLINYTFGNDSIEFLKSKSDIVKDLSVEREPMTLQFEYLFVSDGHRGHHLPDGLITIIEDTALAAYPELKKCQFQLFRNNERIIKLFGKHGYKVVRSYKSTNPDILDYLPSDEKLVMEKEFGQ